MDASAAVLVVMTPEAEQFERVEAEIAQAEQAGIPLFPVLLSGDVFFQLNNVAHWDVTGGQLPM